MRFAFLLRPFEALVLGGLFFLAFRYPSFEGLGLWEALLAFAFPALLMEAAQRGRHALWLYVPFVIGFGGLFHWVPRTLEIMAPMPYSMALLATVLLVLWESMGLWAGVLLARFVFKHRGILAASFALGAWVWLWELFAFHVYPWCWGSALGGLPWMAKSAAFVGAPGLSAWIWGCGAFMGFSLVQEGYSKRLLRPFLAWIGLPAGLGLLWFALPQGPQKTLDIVMIQPNFDPGKAFPEMEADMWRRTDMALAEARLPRTDRTTLVIWPESSVMVRNDLNPVNGAGRPAWDRGVAWLYGTDGRDLNGWYNLVRGEQEGQRPFIQAKVNPMDFGERMPGPEWMRQFLDRALGFSSQAKGSLSTQSTFRVKTPQGDLQVHPLICSEALLALRMVKGLDGAGGELITNHTNDGWFEKSCATDLHAAQIRLRAVEAGVPMIRATLTGKSGVFYANGTGQLWGDARSEGHYVLPLEWRMRKTPARSPWLYGVMLLGIAMATTLFAWPGIWRRKPKSATVNHG